MNKISSNTLASIIFLLLMTTLVACGNPQSSEKTDPVLNSSETAPSANENTQAAEKMASEAGQKSGFSYMDSVVWAVNVGGAKFNGVDGHVYAADEASIGGQAGVINTTIKGTQDVGIYQSYRSGDIKLNKSLPNGQYDVIFKFAEPLDVQTGERVFDILAEGEPVVKHLDVRQARDGNARAALARAVTNVEVVDGELNIAFKASAGEPFISAFIVRKKFDHTRPWKLVWSDEFDYAGKPDPEKWTHDIWPAKKVNRELQTYTDRLKNVRVEDGKLILEAYKEKYNNADYTSGRIHTADKGDLLYGKIDIRAKLPPGQGTWPAIWMLPSTPFKYATNCEAGEDWQGAHIDACDAWPNSGEIDIMEHVGYDMNNVHGTVHNRAYYWVNGEQRKGSVNSVNAESEFHVYSIEWTPEKITILFDNVPYFFYMNEGEGWKAWPYDHPYHLILNVAVGGDWGLAGGPIDDSVFPVRMEVDYVRMYQ